jgi:DNA-binding transcriptional MerR regulator
LDTSTIGCQDLEEDPVRISELARETGVPVPTIKFYLRERLLPQGTPTSATQAQYGADHVARLRLIRALMGPGGLSIAAVRRVLEAMDDPPASPYELICAAGAALTRPGAAVDHTRVHALLAAWGVDLAAEDCRSHDDLAAALAGADAAGFALPDDALARYHEQLSALAQREIDGVPTDSPAEAVRYVVLGTVLVEPVLLALRRLAHRELTARRFGPGR